MQRKPTFACDTGGSSLPVGEGIQGSVMSWKQCENGALLSIVATQMLTKVVTQMPKNIYL
jgi:hypothetical protein